MPREQRSRSIGLSILLVALACQGLTPDARDIASVNLLRLLRTERGGPADSTATARNGVVCRATPSPSGVPGLSRDGDRDGLPDEVCGPARPSASARWLLKIGSGAMRLAPASAVSIPRTAGIHAFGMLSLQTRAARGEDLIHAICRLTC